MPFAVIKNKQVEIVFMGEEEVLLFFRVSDLSSARVLVKEQGGSLIEFVNQSKVVDERDRLCYIADDGALVVEDGDEREVISEDSEYYHYWRDIIKSLNELIEVKIVTRCFVKLGNDKGESLRELARLEDEIHQKIEKLKPKTKEIKVLGYGVDHNITSVSFSRPNDFIDYMNVILSEEEE